MKEELKAAYDAAGVKADWLTIKSVCLLRDTQTLTVTVERRQNLITEPACRTWESAIRSLMPAYAVDFVYIDVKPEVVVSRPVPQKKNEVDVPLPENGSRTASPSSEEASIIRSNNPSGFCVGCFFRFLLQ